MFDFLSAPEFQTALGTIILVTVSSLTALVLGALYAFIKSNTSQTQFDLLRELAQSAVLAAEQGQLAGFVTDKKKSAIAIVQAHLTQMGLTGITATQIDAAIETAVLASFNAYKTAPQPVYPFYPIEPEPQGDEPTP